MWYSTDSIGNRHGVNAVCHHAATTLDNSEDAKCIVLSMAIVRRFSNLGGR